MVATILVVEDEANIRSSLEKMLTQDGHQVMVAENGETALGYILTQTFDLALIDLKLPGVGGIEVLATLHEQSPETVAIVLTAHASLKTAVEALRQGAHDYLFKPCNPAELRESIRQGLQNRHPQMRQQELLNRLEELSGNLEEIRSAIIEEHHEPPLNIVQPATQKNRFVQAGSLIMDRLRHVITLDGRPLRLSPTEFDLLAYLIDQSPRTVSHQELIREARGYDSEPWEAHDTMRSHIYHIRRKIKDTTGRTDIIRTERGIGYTISR